MQLYSILFYEVLQKFLHKPLRVINFKKHLTKNCTEIRTSGFEKKLIPSYAINLCVMRSIYVSNRWHVEFVVSSTEKKYATQKIFT